MPISVERGAGVGFGGAGGAGAAGGGDAAAAGLGAAGPVPVSVEGRLPSDGAAPACAPPFLRAIASFVLSISDWVSNGLTTAPSAPARAPRASSYGEKFPVKSRMGDGNPPARSSAQTS